MNAAAAPAVAGDSSGLRIGRPAFDAPDGALTAVLGPPGAGKSALLRRLARARDIAPDGARLRRRDIALAAPTLGLLPHLTLAANVALPLALRGVPRADRRRLALAALDAVEVAAPHRRLRDTGPADQARAGWARASIASPRLLLLDDPLALEPPAARAPALWILQRLHRLAGATTLLATADGEAALALAEHVVVLESGRVAQTGQPAEIYARPISTTVARLAGPAILLPGQVIAAEEGLVHVRLRCGPTALGTADRAFRAGDPCLLFLRPEHIAIAAASAADLGEDALDATVAGIMPHGDRLRLHLLLGHGAAIEIVRPALAQRSLAPGARVAIAWQPEHARVLG